MIFSFQHLENLLFVQQSSYHLKSALYNGRGILYSFREYLYSISIMYLQSDLPYY